MPFVSGDKLDSTNRVRVAIGQGSARNGSDLDPGTYLLSCDTSCYLKQGDSSVTVSATDASCFLAAGGGLTLVVNGPTNARFAVIQQSAGGSLFIQQVTAA